MVSYALNGKATGLKFTCLNPYCSGRWSRTYTFLSFAIHYIRLNPYCSGRWSRTEYVQTFANDIKIVLILIVVEDGLVQPI